MTAKPTINNIKPIRIFLQMRIDYSVIGMAQGRYGISFNLIRQVFTWIRMRPVLLRNSGGLIQNRHSRRSHVKRRVSFFTTAPANKR